MKTSWFEYVTVAMIIISAILIILSVTCMIYFWHEGKHMRWIGPIIVNSLNLVAFYFNRQTDKSIRKTQEYLNSRDSDF